MQSGSQVSGLGKAVGWRSYRRKLGLGVKMGVQGWAMMRMWCLWEIQVEVAR